MEKPTEKRNVQVMVQTIIWSKIENKMKAFLILKIFIQINMSTRREYRLTDI